MANAFSSIRTSKESDVFQGTTWDTEVYVNIRWGWLSFLAAELVLAIAFITFTAFETYRTAVPVLKSSALAASLALDGEAQQSIGSIDNLSSAEDKSKLARVRFNHGNLTLVPNVINAYNSGGIASDSSIVYSIN